MAHLYTQDLEKKQAQEYTQISSLLEKAEQINLDTKEEKKVEKLEKTSTFGCSISISFIFTFLIMIILFSFPIFQ